MQRTDGKRVVLLEDAPPEGEHEVAPEPPGQTFGVEAAAGDALDLGDDLEVRVQSTIGIIHLQLFDARSREPLAGEPYRLTSEAGETLGGTTGPEGDLRHEQVQAGLWTLELDGSGAQLRAPVLDADEAEPLVRHVVRRGGR